MKELGDIAQGFAGPQMIDQRGGLWARLSLRGKVLPRHRRAGQKTDGNDTTDHRCAALPLSQPPHSYPLVEQQSSARAVTLPAWFQAPCQALAAQKTSILAALERRWGRRVSRIATLLSPC